MKKIKLITLNLFIILTYSCNDKFVIEPEAKKIGQTYEGGTIFYLDKTGSHGLIAAPSDDSTNLGTGGTATNFPPFQVTGITGIIGTQLQKVKVNISHGSIGNISIQLKAPNGHSIYLSQWHGGTGSDYTNTTFQTGGSQLSSGTAPFSGNYAPDDAFSNLSSSTASGNWSIIIVNNSQIYQGKLIDCTITLNNTDFLYIPPRNKFKTWDNGSHQNTIATETANGSGQRNTTKIINQNSFGGYAARVCSDLTVNGKSDWYLPSKDELALLYTQKSIIPDINPTVLYWSSTEINTTNAYSINFSSGTSNSTSKSNICYVRAIRSF